MRSRVLIISLCLVAALAPGISAQRPVCGEVLSDWPAGCCLQLAADRGVLLMRQGQAVIRVDPEDALRPLGLERFEGVVNHVTATGGLAFVGSSNTFSTLDLGLSGPGAPVIGSVEMPDTVFEAAVDGNLAIVTVDRYYPYELALHLVDLSDPTAPVVKGELELPPGSAFGLELIGGLVYRTSARHLEVFDIGDPGHPEPVAEQLCGLGCEIVARNDRFVVVATGQTLRFFDIQDPASPVLAASWETNAVVQSAGWKDELLVVAEEQFFEVLEISPSNEINRVGTIDSAPWVETRQLEVVNDYAVTVEAGDASRLHIVSLADPSLPCIISTADRPGTLCTMDMDGSRAAYATWDDLWTLDLTSLAGPGDEGHLPLDYLSDRVAIKGDLIVVGSEHDPKQPGFGYRLDVVEAAEGGELETIGHLEFPSDPEDRWISSALEWGREWIALAFDKAGNDELYIVDLDNPATPRTVASIQLPGEVTGTQTRDSVLFTVIAGRVLIAVDMTDPTAPRVLGHLDLQDQDGIYKNCRGLDGWGRYLYTACSSSLNIIDSVDPTAMEVMATVPTQSPSFELASHQGTLVVKQGNELDLLAVGDPLAPTSAGTFEILGCQWDRIYLDTAEDTLTAFGGGRFCGLQMRDLGSCIELPMPLPANFAVSVPRVIAGQSIQFLDHSVGDPDTWIWDLGDGSASFDRNPHHVYEAAGSYIVNLTVANTTALSTIATVIQVIEAELPLQAGFTWISATGTIAVPVYFYDQSTGSPTRWHWNFGDGYTADEQNPSHLYALPGEYEVLLEVEKGESTTAVSHRITIETATDYGAATDLDQLIPAAAAVDGAAGTRWRTDLSLHNPTDEVAATLIHLFDRSMPANQTHWGQQVNLHPRQTVVISDVVGSLFGEESTGALTISRDHNVLATSRTFTSTADHGTWGQAVPAVMISELPVRDLKQVLPGLIEDERYRCNMGLVNMYSGETEVQLNAYSSDGQEVGQVLIPVLEREYLQINRILNQLAPWSRDPITIEISADRNGTQAWASMVDNQSGDAVFIPARTVADTFDPTHLLVPAVALTSGALGTQWRSELVLYNPGEPATLGLSLLASEGMPPLPQVTVEMGAKSTLRIGDLISNLFHLEQYTGALVIEAATTVVARSRTFTESIAGTFGQNVPVVPVSSLPTTGEWAMLFQLREDAAYRTNIGFANPADSPARIRLEAFRMNGTAAGEMTVELGSFSHRQINRALADLVGAEAGQITIRATIEIGSAAIYSSVVDNISGDPVFMLAVPDRQ